MLPFGISSTDLIALAIAVGLLLLDFFLGTGIAFFKTPRDFSWAKLPHQFETLILLNGGGIAIASFVQGALSGTTSFSDAAIGVIVLWAGVSSARSLADIKVKVMVIFGPTPAPAVVV